MPQLVTAPLPATRLTFDAGVYGGFQKAANAAAAAGGGVVLIPPGEFESENLTVVGGFESGIEVRGSGMDKSSLKVAAGTTGDFLVGTGGYLYFHDFHINGNSQNVDSLLKIGTTASGSPRTNVERVTGRDAAAGGGATGHGIVIEGASGQTSHGNQLANCRIHDCAGTGLLTTSFTYDTMLDNVWIGDCNVGLDLGAGSNMITGCHIWGSTADNVQTTTDGNMFSGCYIETAGEWGVDLSSAAQKNTFTGCRIWANGSGGIRSAGSQNNVNACMIEENVGPGISISGTGNVVAGNTFADYQGTKTQTFCVETTGGGDDTTIVGNGMVGGYLTAPFSLANTGDKIKNNVIDGSNRNSGAGDKTLAYTDLDKSIEFTSFSATATLTVPEETTTRFPHGTVIGPIINYGDEEVSIVGAGSVNIRSQDAVLRNRFEFGYLEKRWVDDWHFMKSYTPQGQSGYTAFTNLATLRTGDANTLTTAELADILGTLIEDLKATGILVG